MWKKMLAVLFVCLFVFFSAVGTVAHAYEEEPQPYSQGQITPRFTHITFISCCIEKRAFGNIRVEGNVQIYISGYTTVVTVVLQRIENGAWVDYKSSSDTFTGTGAHVHGDSFYAPRGYLYRGVTRAQIKNSSGTVVENASCLSGTTIQK